jgi:hypothetical protein
MIIDAHLHITLQGFTAQKVINYLDKYRIDRCWLLTWEEFNPAISRLYEPITIDDTIEAYEKYPERIIPFYAPDPQKKQLEQTVNKYINKGIKGIGELKVNYRWHSPIIDNYLKTINKLKLPVLFHMENERYHYVNQNDTVFEKFLYLLLNGARNGITRKYIEKFIDFSGFFKKNFKKQLVFFPGYLLDFSELEKKLIRYPSINFIAHGPHFWNNIATEIDPYKTLNKGKIKKAGIISELLFKYDNLFADISGKSGFNALTRDKNYAKIFLEKHYNKLLFGTDNNELNQIELIKSYKLPVNKEQKIFYKNAEQIID